MDCHVAFVNRGLYCTVHNSDSMSRMCETAEQQLRDEMARLEGFLAEYEEMVDTLREHIRRLEGP